MITTRLRRLLVVMLACGVGLVAVPAPASACSCVGAGPAEMLESHDGAFIGEVVSRRGGLLGFNATWTFKVDEEIKGRFGPTVEISSPSSGASCGFELTEGQEAAIFVRDEGRRLESGLCSTLDADALRAYLDPQRAVASRATLLVAAGGAGRHLWLFDDRGRLANASADGRGDYVEDITVCPGGTTLIELWHRRIVVRDMRTLRARRTQRVPGTVGRIWCRDAAGDDVLAARRDNRTGDYASIVSLAAVDRPVLSGTWIDLEVVGNDLVATADRDFTQLRRISLRDGRETVLHAARNKPGVAVHINAGIEGFALSPDGTRVAFEITIYPDDGSPSSDVFVYDLATGRQEATTNVAVEGIEVRWLDDETLLFSSYDADDEAAQLLDADTLKDRTALPAEAQWPQTRGPDGTLLGMDGPRLASVDPATGDIRTLATIPAEYSSSMIRLPRPVKVRATSEQRRPEPPAAPAAAEPAGPSGTANFTAPARRVPATVSAAVAVTLLAAGFLVLRTRRRRA